MEIPLGRMNVRFEDINSIEAQAFKVCNTDGEEGLTWLEVEACEVKMVLNSNLPPKLSVISHAHFGCC